MEENSVRQVMEMAKRVRTRGAQTSWLSIVVAGPEAVSVQTLQSKAASMVLRTCFRERDEEGEGEYKQPANLMYSISHELMFTIVFASRTHQRSCREECSQSQDVWLEQQQEDSFMIIDEAQSSPTLTTSTARSAHAYHLL